MGMTWLLALSDLKQNIMKATVESFFIQEKHPMTFQPITRLISVTEIISHNYRRQKTDEGSDREPS